MLSEQLEAQGVSADRAGGRGRSLAELTVDVAHSLSGIACWPRLVLDPGDGDEPPIVIESRGANGEPRTSHWQTVLPLLCSTPTPVKAGDLISVRLAVELSAEVETPPQYAIEATISESRDAE